MTGSSARWPGPAMTAGSASRTARARRSRSASTTSARARSSCVKNSRSTGAEAAMSKALAGKVAVVTGSSIGLGAAIATALAREGARVAVTGIPHDRGKALAGTLGNESFFVEGDLRDVRETRGIIEATLEKTGGIDILVNNAAISERASIEDFTPEYFDRVIQVNLRAPLLLSQAALPSLKKRGGVILNVGSVNSYAGWQNLLVYSAAKAGL